MLLFIEIILTIVTWRKGWRGYALIPGISALLLGFIIGTILTSMGYSEIQIRQLKLILIPLDFVCIGVLGWMATKSRNRVIKVVHKDELNLESPNVATKTI